MINWLFWCASWSRYKLHSYYSCIQPHLRIFQEQNLLHHLYIYLLFPFPCVLRKLKHFPHPSKPSMAKLIFNSRICCHYVLYLTFNSGYLSLNYWNRICAFNSKGRYLLRGGGGGGVFPSVMRDTWVTWLDMVSNYTNSFITCFICRWMFSAFIRRCRNITWIYAVKATNNCFIRWIS